MLVPKKTAPEKVDFNSEKYKVDLSKNDYKQDVCFFIQDKVILTYGSFLVLTGKPKARKSTFLHSFINAALINDSIWNIKGNLLPEKNKVVLIDTEQSIYDLHTSLTRLAKNMMCELKELQNFDVYTARSGDVETIKKLIETVCKENKEVGIICIDGLIDLVNDINDVREAKEAISFIKYICDTYYVAIIGILHQNKGSNFSLGHLGSFASRFAQSELSIEKNESGSSTMKPVFLRSADSFSDIEIFWNENLKRYDIEGNIQNSWTFEDYERFVINDVYNLNLNFALSYSQLKERFIQALNLSRYEIEKKIIPYLFEKNILEKRHNLYYLK
jgi:hypothetical protein